MRKSLGNILVIFCVAAAQAAERWTLKEPRAWIRKGKAESVAVDGGHAVTFEGDTDWSFAGIGRIKAQPGDIFEIRCRVKADFDSKAGASAQCSAIIYDARGEALSWSWAEKSISAGEKYQSVVDRFVIPRGAVELEPRLMGYKDVKLNLQKFVLEKKGKIATKELGMPMLKNRYLSLAFFPEQGVFNVKHLGCAREWTQDAALDGMFVKNIDVTPDASGAVMSFIHAETMQELEATFQLDNSAPEFTVTLRALNKVTTPVEYPAAFATAPGERLIVPANEGMGYPVDQEHSRLHRLIAFGGHGICMGFFGCIRDAEGSGWMCILETPDDVSFNPSRGPDGLWRAAPLWEPSRGEFSYPRKARYIFFDKGGHVAICKRYREYAKKIGLFKPFTEKVRERPAIDLLIGAANIWNWDKDKVGLVKELQAAGIDRILWSGSGSAEQISEMNKLPGVLTGRYDIYQDIMDPSRYSELDHISGDWVEEAFPHDINYAAPGVRRNGWQVTRKDGKGRIPCAVICDSKALPYARKRIKEDLAKKPFKARFIDTTVAAPWLECYHPDHPMTRTQSKEWKMKLLNVVSGEFGLVCGSETGHDASVPFCDYYEGMLSICSYRVHEAGRNIMQKIDEVPPRITNYQVNEKYRLPLWELVYHDCVVAQWYWGDYNNKLPKVWHKRDLFNALYGTPPMYMFTQKEWQEQKAKFVESYKIAEPVSRATGYSEMTDHRILTADRTVQQTIFANGVKVTVNFGSQPYKMPDGRTIPPMDLLIEGM